MKPIALGLGLVAFRAVLSPKFHECVLMLPPESVEVSVKFAVKPLVVNVKFAAGVPPVGALTVTACVLVLVLPLTLSVTVSDTLYVPAAA